MRGKEKERRKSWEEAGGSLTKYEPPLSHHPTQFGNTGDQLLEFKQQMTKGLADATSSQVSSRLNMLDYENEVLRKREEERKLKERSRASGAGGMRGRARGRDEIHKNPTADQAESDMKEVRANSFLHSLLATNLFRAAVLGSHRAAPGPAVHE